MRLIDADALKEKCPSNLGAPLWLIDAMPTIAAEPKHGRWIESWGGKWHSCSVCGGIPPFNFKGEDLLTDYCPHCGAKMDEVENALG